MPLAIDFVDGLRDICDKNNCSLTDLAIAWILAQGDFINVICGAHKPEQIAADIDAANVILPKEDIEEIRKRVESLDIQMKAQQ